MERDLRGVEADAGVTGGRDDAAPIGVGAGDRRLHQRAVGDRLGDLPGVVLRLAAVDFDGDQVRRPFAVGGNRLGQVFADFVERGAEFGERLAREHRAAGRAVGQQQHRVVGAHVAVDADAIERFVDRVGERGLGVGLGERRVGHDQREHRRHVRADHRGALGDAGDRDRLAADLDDAAANLGHGVGRHHAAGGPFERGFVGAEFGGQLAAMPARIFSSGSISPMTPVDITSASSARAPHDLGRPGGHLRGVAVALLAGAGVGDAGVDRHAADAIARRARRGRNSPARRTPDSACRRRRRPPADRRRPATDRAYSGCV